MTGHVVVSMTAKPPLYAHEGTRWSSGDVKRLKLAERVPSRSHRAGQLAVSKVYACGEGVIVERDGQRVRCQIWCDAAYVNHVWLKVYEAEAAFPGEMALASVDKDGHVTGVTLGYQANGEKRRTGPDPWATWLQRTA